MPRQQYTRSELYDFCDHFYKFLDDQKITAEPTTKEKLRDVFKRDFKPNTELKLPCFSMIMFNMKRFKFVTIRDRENVLFMGQPKLKIKSKKISVEKLLPTGISESESSCGSKKSSRSSRRSLKKKSMPLVMLSVDQHLALKDKTNNKKQHQTSEAQNPFYCTLCKVGTNTKKQLHCHRLGTKHRLNSGKKLLEMQKSGLITDKGDISIFSESTLTNEVEGEMRKKLEIGEPKRIMITVQNTGSSAVNLQLCEALQYYQFCHLDDPQGVTITRASVTINAGSSYQILSTCTLTSPGEVVIPIFFKFTRNNSIFKIMRKLILMGSTSIMEDLKPTAPYKAPPRAAIKFTPKLTIPGLPFAKNKQNELEQILKPKLFLIPTTLRTLVNHGLKPFPGMSENMLHELQEIWDMLENPLTFSNYKKLFQLLLYLEEFQMDVDIRQYDMKEVPMNIVNERRDLLLLQVPGLAEKRPSVLKTDHLYVQKVVSSNKIGGNEKEYQGIVHEVRECEVWLGFDKSFRDEFINNQSLNVRFTFNRFPIRLQHRAVCLAEELSLNSFLFPEKKVVYGKNIVLPELKLYNPRLYDNERQLEAIKVIVSGCSRPNPYIVFGPPGTGKTVTIVEAMKQVLKHNDKCHILACAPSNNAADLLAERLLEHVSPKDMFRMFADSRALSAVPTSLHEIANYDKRTGSFYYPRKEKIMEYKIVVTTLVTAGRLAGANFPPMHFTHVFIDEAGQAIEPEALVAIGGILECVPGHESGQVVLAGDPQQLGPVLRSPLAIAHGLGISLLERLMTKCEVYKRNEGEQYDSLYITKLLRNYRSHPSILTVPNNLFYDDELQPHADELVRNSLCNWDGLPKKNIPIIFHGVVGKDEREARSPSFFNTAEVSIVLDYVTDLLSTRNVNIKPSSIGIISPYNQQVRKIRKALQLQNSKIHKRKEAQNKDFTAVTVGSTEEFQGQERLVIIISTVRSSPELLQEDEKFKLGFLRNPKRFNVAVTRAKALLIVVGNPHILSLDRHWNSLLEYCSTNGAMKGIPYCTKDDTERMLQQLALLKLEEDIDAAVFDVMECGSAQTEQAWRNDP